MTVGGNTTVLSNTATTCTPVPFVGQRCVIVDFCLTYCHTRLHFRAWSWPDPRKLLMFVCRTDSCSISIYEGKVQRSRSDG